MPRPELEAAGFPSEPGDGEQPAIARVAEHDHSLDARPRVAHLEVLRRLRGVSHPPVVEPLTSTSLRGSLGGDGPTETARTHARPAPDAALQHPDREDVRAVGEAFHSLSSEAASERNGCA